MAEVRQIRIETDKGAPDHVVFRSTLNQFPSINLRYHQSTESGVIATIGSDTAAAAAADQLVSMEPKLEPDTTVVLDDGKGNIVSFSGMLIQPGHEVGVGGVGSSCTIIHESALISVFDPSIYEVLEPAGSEGRLRFTDESVMTRALEILKETIEFWTSPPAGDVAARVRGSEESEALKDQIHSQNMLVYDKVVSLFEGSDTDFPGLGGLDQYHNVSKAANFDIFNTLFASRDDFLQTIHALMGRWNFYYVPTFKTGEVGRIRIMERILEVDERKETVIQTMQISAGSRSFMPVTQVLVEGIGGFGPGNYEDSNPEDSQAETLSPKTFAAFPETFRGGKAMRQPLPPFLTLPLASTTGSEGTTLEVAAYAQAQAGERTDLNAFSEQEMTDFARTWAKQHYVDIALADSTVSMTVDFDLSWQVGLVYEVSATARGGGGESLPGSAIFTGLLSYCESICSSSRTSLQASTSLQFTHVRVRSNTLPMA